MSDHHMKKSVSINNDIFEFYLSEKKIQTKIRQMARQINKEYRGKAPVFDEAGTAQTVSEHG